MNPISDTAQAIVLTVYVLAVIAALAVGVGAAIRQYGQRTEQKIIENTYAWTLQRTRQWQADYQGRRTDTWINPGMGRHRRPDPVVAVSAVPPASRVEPPNPAAVAVQRIFTQAMSVPAPAEVDIEQIRSELVSWAADPNHTGPIPRVIA